MSEGYDTWGEVKLIEGWFYRIDYRDLNLDGVTDSLYLMLPGLGGDLSAALTVFEEWALTVNSILEARGATLLGYGMMAENDPREG